MNIKPTLAAGLIYFVAVFGVGFLLGIVRVSLIEPWAGTRWAELAEMPVMLAAIIAASRWVVRRMTLTTLTASLATGLLALSLLVAAELTLVLSLRGISVAEYVDGRDPVSGTVYVVMLLVFAVMPTFVMCLSNFQRENPK